VGPVSGCKSRDQKEATGADSGCNDRLVCGGFVMSASFAYFAILVRMFGF
jgi:hypothetical protein